MLLLSSYHQFLNKLHYANGLPALLIRLYLAPIFIMAGYSKLQFSDSSVSGVAQLFASPEIVEWFGNTDWGLGLPFPEVLANLAAWSEFLGGWLILIGLFTRLISIPLMFTMIIAATSVHGENGWFAITPTNPDISPAKVFVWLGFEQAEQSLENSIEADKRLEAMRSLLAENGHTEWLYETGSIVVLNNGIEFAATYFLLLLALFFIGAGRFTSMDYYLYNHWLKPRIKNNYQI
ncbi:DoxX family protein [Colwellia sp. 1_MG-2023]|uniref:HvfX family Cu-binding RiPP maturation protein n=1 Tax=Colwellia sp. 1_MG-2023 TaxID=3062649 RepID=UPI0026E4409C|nr:DoxX family protein [Colwellia sp. 1_MG-2023]MDO6446987.1 DoxX family protein [Colwellia sp. 1_MG-2023]